MWELSWRNLAAYMAAIPQYESDRTQEEKKKTGAAAATGPQATKKDDKVFRADEDNPEMDAIFGIVKVS